MYAPSHAGTRGLLVIAMAASLLPAPAARAQIAGENVNMVSGVEWPGGDPFLQRQNEPTLAVSSANPQHLMAGANDYRSVDVPVPDAHFAKMKATPDAWLGVFKSLDGGQTWKSTLLPGFVGDESREGTGTPLRAPLGLKRPDGTTESIALPACADPVMRSGTDGMFYYAGINFSRDKRASRVFIARYLDLNDRENGDAARSAATATGGAVAAPTDPIRYVDTVIVSANLPARPNVFIDKPWIAVDVPRPGAQLCTISTTRADGTPVTRTFPGGTVYAAWAEFEQPDELRSDIMFTWSSNCGQTWVTPYKISSSNSVLSQGVSLAVEPVTGRVYAAWRRAATSLAPRQTDAIMATRSEGRKRYFSHARVVAPLAAGPFDQGTSYGSFRSNAFPSLAISSDGTSSWGHIAWADRQASGDARVVLSTAKVHPRPVGDDDDDDPEDFDDETRLAWSRPAPVDLGAIVDDANHAFGRGHQFMPALTAGQGRLVITYYDSRTDHTRRYFRPRTPVAGEFPGGKFYDEELAPIGDYDLQLAIDAAATGGAADGPVFNRWLADSFPGVDAATGQPTLTAVVAVRHTVEIRAAVADAGPSPSFRSIAVSRFPFGASGEGNPGPGEPLTVPRFASSTSPAPPSAGAKPGAELTIVDGQGGLQLLSQFQMNPPNFPLFKNGSVAFIGDYIDVAGPTFVVKNGAWSFNTARSATPVFHAAWTSNQDVRTPPIDPATRLPAWDRYVPPGLGGISRYLNDGTPRAACDPAAPAFAGSRDQNVYTARITEGLSVSTPQNVKPLAEPDAATGQPKPVRRSFVISAANSTARPMEVAFSASLPAGLTGVELSWVASGAGSAAPAVQGIVVPAFSSVSQTLFARLTSSTASPGTTIYARVDQTGACTATATCASATLTLNPPVALASLLQPDGAPANLQNVGAGEKLQAVAFDRFLSDPNWSNPNWSNANPNPNWSNPNWSNPNWSNLGYTGPNWSNPNWSNLGFTNPNWSNPNWSNPNWSNPNWSNPNWSNPNWSNPNWSNPNWSNPNWSNPNWSNPNWSNATVSDLNSSLQNTGNTTTAYSVKLVQDSTRAVSYTGKIQLLITKVYETPTLDGCSVRPKPNFQLAVNVPDMPLVPSNARVDPALDALTGFATVTLAPGERALVTIRAQLSIAEMAELGKAVAAAAVPQDYPVTTVTYADVRGSATSPVALPGSLATTTRLDPAGAGGAYVATVAPVNGPGTPTGSVTLVRATGSRSRTAALVRLGGGVASAAIDPPLAAGETLTAYYGGDVAFDPSTSAPLSGGTRRLLVRAAVDHPTTSATSMRVRILEADGVTPVTGATVWVNGGPGQGGYQLPHLSAGQYGGSIGIQEATSLVALAIQDGPAGATTGVAGAVVIPYGATVTSPSAGASVVRTAPFSVSWTNAGGSALPHAYQLVFSPATTQPGIAGAVFAGIAPTQSSFSVPAASLQAASYFLRVEEVTHGTLAGDFAPTSSYDATTATPGQTIDILGAAPALTVSGAVNAGLVRISVARGGLPYAGASVTLTSGATQTPVPPLGTGEYQTSTFALPAAGQTLTLTVTDGLSTVTGTAQVPGQPALIAPTALDYLPAAEPIGVQWSYPAGLADPSGFALEGKCGPLLAQCAPGVWQRLPGTARSATLPARFLQPLDTVQLPVFAYNDLALSGDAGAGSGVIVNNVSPAVTFHTVLARMPTPRAGPATASLGGLVYAAGGYEYVGGAQVYASSAAFEVYDRATDTWTRLPSMPTARQGAAAVALNGLIYVLGGFNAGFLATVEIYDPATGSWSTGPSMPDGRYYFGAAVLNGQIYTVGGWNGAPSSVVHRFTPSAATAGTWATVASLPASSAQLAAVATGGRIYAYGGYSGTALGGLYAYDPAANAWSTLPSMITPRYLLAGAAAGGLVYAMGGNTGLGSSAAVEAFDPAANAWAVRPSLPYPRNEVQGAEVGGVPYVVGGFGPVGLSGFIDPVTP